MGLGSFKLEETDALPDGIGARRKRVAAIPTQKIGIGTAPTGGNWARRGAELHASAPDVAKFFAEFLHAAGKVVKPETARLMTQNHNPANLTPRGLGFALGSKASAPNCSEQTFSHSGATGTLAWADPATDTICVVLTTLPERAAKPHPTCVASEKVAEIAA